MKIRGVVIIAALTVAVAKAAHHVVYANGATSESDLPLCSGPFVACNVVRDRFGFPKEVLRICKCPDLTECPTEWTDGRYTMMVNAGKQLKFCNEVRHLKKCRKYEISAEVRNNSAITIHCFCGQGNYFRRIEENETVEYFRCWPIKPCRIRDGHCGYITETNSYETYLHCTCEPPSICIYDYNLEDRLLVNDTELFLHKGPSYEAFCSVWWNI